MIILAHLKEIRKALKDAFTQAQFAMFVQDNMDEIFADFVPNEGFEIQLNVYLNKIFKEGRIADLLKKAADAHPADIAIKNWVEQAQVEEKKLSDPHSIVMVKGKAFIGRDDFRQQVASGFSKFNKGESMVVQLQSEAPRSGLTYSYWYLSHFISGGVTPIEINMHDIYFLDGEQVEAIQLAEILTRKMGLNFQAGETQGPFKISPFIGKLENALRQKDAKFLVFIDQFRDTEISDDCKRFIWGLMSITRSLNNLCIITSFPEQLDLNALPNALSIKLSPAFTEPELREFFKNFYEFLQKEQGESAPDNPNAEEVTEAQFVEMALDNFKSDLAQKNNIEIIGQKANAFCATALQSIR